MSVSPFTAAHRFYVKSLYKRYLVNALNWNVRRDLWRQQALEIRAEFERNRNVHDPRALAEILAKAEENLAAIAHPDPYIVPSFPGGTKWERNLPPRVEPIFDHYRDERDTKVQALIHTIETDPEIQAELKAIDGTTSEFLEEIRKISPYVDSYLNDKAADAASGLSTTHDHAHAHH